MARSQQMRPVPNAQVYQDNNGNYYLIENQNSNRNGNSNDNGIPITMTNTQRNHNGRRGRRNSKCTREISKVQTQRTEHQNRQRDHLCSGFASPRNNNTRLEYSSAPNNEGEQRDFSQCMLTCRLYITRNRSGGSFVDSRVHSCVRYGKEDVLNHHTKINIDYRGGESDYSLYVYPLFFEATTENNDMFTDFQETINRFRSAYDNKRPQSLATGKKYFLPFPSVRAQQNLQHNGYYVVSLLLNTELLNNTENQYTENDLINRLSSDLAPFGMNIENHYVRYNDNFPQCKKTTEETTKETTKETTEKTTEKTTTVEVTDEITEEVANETMEKTIQVEEINTDNTDATE